MIYNYITITDSEENKTSFYPGLIEHIDINTEFITIEYWEDIDAKKTTTYILKRENYYYSHWDGFINTLRIIFNLDE